MSFRITASSSSASRIKKPGTLGRSSSSPFASAKRKRPSNPTLRRKSTTAAQDEDEEHVLDSRMSDDGLIASLANDLNYSDVAQLIRLILDGQYAPIPETASGMNSARIAEVLNHRKRLPPIVSLAHIHALSKSPTATEREIAALTNAGIIRRIVIPGRGRGGSAVGEGLVLVSEWEKIVQENEILTEEMKEKYSSALRDPAFQPLFTPPEIQALIHSGLLTLASTSQSQLKADVWLRPGASTLGSLPTVATAGSKHYSGSFGAAAEGSKDHISGGSGATTSIRGSTTSKSTSSLTGYTFAIPNTGPYLKLLSDSRAHLMTLLSKSSKYREAPLTMLRERWDGGVSGGTEAERAQRARGEWVGVLPGRTKKWKTFYGLRFEWVLEECLGSGMVECFKSGVGMGVRGL